MMTKADVARKVRALLATDGCTEAEAMARVEKARELMDRYNIERGSLEMEQDGTEARAYARGKDKKDWNRTIITDTLLKPIADFCDVQHWRSRSTNTVNFFGLRSDTDFAMWLLESLRAFVETQTALYYMTALFESETGKISQQEEYDFVMGACIRIKERLNEMVGERKASSTGRALIPLKNQIVTREWADYVRRTGLSLGKYNVGGHTQSSAFHAGRAAGDKATFARPVSRGGVKLIGGR
jgi:hypothetical protein